MPSKKTEKEKTFDILGRISGSLDLGDSNIMIKEIRDKRTDKK